MWAVSSWKEENENDKWHWLKNRIGVGGVIGQELQHHLGNGGDATIEEAGVSKQLVSDDEIMRGLELYPDCGLQLSVYLTACLNVWLPACCGKFLFDMTNVTIHLWLLVRLSVCLHVFLVRLPTSLSAYPSISSLLKKIKTQVKLQQANHTSTATSFSSNKSNWSRCNRLCSHFYTLLKSIFSPFFLRQTTDDWPTSLRRQQSGLYTGQRELPAICFASQLFPKRWPLPQQTCCMTQQALEKKVN